MLQSAYQCNTNHSCQFSMKEQLLNVGMFSPKLILDHRYRTPVGDLESTTKIAKDIEMITRDTEHPDSQIFSLPLFDETQGQQEIRVVKSPKPNAPDFTKSAQTLTFLLPKDIHNRIATPLDGSEATWQKFLEISRGCIESMNDFYHAKAVTGRTFLIGINFSPYESDATLMTQSVKTIHMHTLMLTDELIKTYPTFDTKNEFINHLRQVHTPEHAIKQDSRKFFSSHLQQIFNQVVTPYLLSRLDGKRYKELSQSQSTTGSTNNRYPLGGINLSGKGLSFMTSGDLYKLLKDTYQPLDEFYRQLFMPIFVDNYGEVIADEDPDPRKLVFNAPDEALYRADKVLALPEFANLDISLKDKARNAVRRVAGMLVNEKQPHFVLGPGYAFSAVYDPTSNNITSYVSYTIFGGGYIEAVGMNKIIAKDSDKELVYQTYYNPDSMAAEQALDAYLNQQLTRRYVTTRNHET
jgi:hypothetical protein